MFSHTWRLNSFLPTLHQDLGGYCHGDIQSGIMSIWEAECEKRAPDGWAVIWQYSVPREYPACKSASNRHKDLQETSVFDHWFYVLGTSIQIFLWFSFTVCPRVSPSSSQGGVFTLNRCFLFQKATMAWKLKFTYKSYSAVWSVQLLVGEVPYLLIFLEDLNSAKLPSVPPGVYSVQQAFPQDPEAWSAF